MKKLLAFVMSLCLLLTFCGCGVPKKAQVQRQSASGKSAVMLCTASGQKQKVTPKKVKTTASKSASKKRTSSSKYVSFDPVHEPPLSEADKKKPAPSFLSKEQQNLYRRAKSMSCNFLAEPGDIERYPLCPGQKEAASVQQCPNHSCYCFSSGRYSKWSRFYSVALSLFTKDCFNGMNRTKEKYPSFFSDRGRLCYSDGGRGGNEDFANIPDTFQLIGRAENKIKFNVIGHYYSDEDGGNAVIDQKKKIKKRYDYTKAFPITMVKTKSGWRFSEFNITW